MSAREAGRDSMEDDLILAREVGRGVEPPDYQGVTIELQGHRVNLWWREGHCRSREFSDAFVVCEDRLVLVVASVWSALDATGLAISVRTYLRAQFAKAATIPSAVVGLEAWNRQDPQWDGQCHLGIGLVSATGELEYARWGNIDLGVIDAEGTRRDLASPDTLPLLLGGAPDGQQFESRTLFLTAGESFTMAPQEDSVASATERDKRGLFGNTEVAAQAKLVSVTQSREQQIEDEIERVREELEGPIRTRNERVFSLLLDVLIERAKRFGGDEEIDRLISHGVAIQQQWVSLAIKDDLMAAWKKSLDEKGVQFLDRYNLFVTQQIDKHSPDRWQRLWNHYQKLLTHNRRISEWGRVKVAEVNPLLKTARQDDPETGQFAPLDEAKFQNVERIYQSLEEWTRKYHKTLLEGLAMQRAWMDEWGCDEPA